MLEKPLVTLFIGQSGCGKGTQAGLLSKRLEELDPKRSIFHLETGDEFRKLISGKSYTSKLAKEIMDRGGIEPAFLAIHVWSHMVIDSYKENQHVIIDGTPRAYTEVVVLDSTLDFYKWKPHIIFINVSDGWAHDRLVGRKREDDLEEEDIKGRLSWFHTSVMPALEHLKKSDNYIFHEINGEQTIEEVHRDICKELSL